MKFPAWVRAHRRSLLLLFVLLALGGGASALRLPVGLFPNVQFPRLLVSLDAGDEPAAEMEVRVTRPVEEAIRSVQGVRRVRSTTSRGSADISANFDWGTDMISAMLQVEAAVSQTVAGFDHKPSFEVRRMDPTVFPVLAYSLTSDTIGLVKLRDIARFDLSPVISGVSGVAKVGILGGKTAEYHVLVDPLRLRAYGLSLHDVAQAVASSNVLVTVGRLEDRYKLFLVVSDNRFKNAEALRHTVLKSGKNGFVELEDVADVEHAEVPVWQRVTADGHDAVLMQVYQQPGGNTVQIASQVRTRLAAMKKKLPGGVRLANWYDQSQLITASAASVRDAIWIGVVLAGLVLLVFLRSWRTMVLAMVMVPVSLAAATLVLELAHMSFNIMTLGGLAAAVGLVVDDAIVSIEQIVRRTSGRERVGAIQAIWEFTPPLAGSSASTTVIFLPLAFLGGVTGAFFRALAVTMAASLVFSFFAAWLLVPLLADKLVHGAEEEKHEHDKLGAVMDRVYTTLARPGLKRVWIPLVAILPLLGAGYLAFARVGSGFMPTMDEGGFILDYRAAAGTSLSETDRLLRQVEAILQSTPEVETYSRRTGAQLGGGITEANEGDFFVRLKPMPRRPIDEVMDDVRARVDAKVPGLDIEMAQLMEDLIGDLTSVPQPIEVKLFGDDPKQLSTVARRLAHAISKVRGVVDVLDGIVIAGDALEVHINRAAAAIEGLTPEAVSQQVETYLAGDVSTQVREGIKLVGVRTWTPASDRRHITDVEKLPIVAPDGHVIPLSRVARVTVKTGQPQIDRENLQRMIAVTGRVSGRDVGSTMVEVKKLMADPKIVPPSIRVELGGLYQEQQKGFRGILVVIIAGLLLEIVLLTFLFERLRIVLAIMSAPLLAIPAVFLALAITGTELNISALMGMSMTVGIVTEVAIFMFTEYVRLEREMSVRDALLLAGRERLRPIAMTTLAAIFALLPLALGIGEGAAMIQPLAIAIIGGLLVQMPLVLLVVPAIFLAMRGGIRGDADAGAGAGAET